ncbi:hypothetical protein [Bradyrhizobium sp. LMTR 3]|uniref:hypothetical protein n=1 Tax=Bradyrhizobium sp. LMTR 3 TaxID=189873 RepID=UPI001FD9D17B|nr:hypothetical protein [Bradyrhizobium sp. LMTR 3]
MKWSARETDVTESRNARLAPTIVKRAFAPSPRAEKTEPVEAAKQPKEVLMKAILKGQPKLETDLVVQARRF